MSGEPEKAGDGREDPVQPDSKGAGEPEIPQEEGQPAGPAGDQIPQDGAKDDAQPDAPGTGGAQPDVHDDVRDEPGTGGAQPDVHDDVRDEPGTGGAQPDVHDDAPEPGRPADVLPAPETVWGATPM
ncbi:MAG: hypothetical protein MPL62_12840, partial [Alphaproteobacteria bacterium]|nr:hypothetical protein [Alphaproteobacteria bacterium]